MNFRAIIWSNNLWFINRHFQSVSWPDCWGVALEQSHRCARGCGAKVFCFLMRLQTSFAAQAVLCWATRTTCSYWRTWGRFSLLSVQCSPWLPCWLQFGADWASLEGHYSEFSADSLFFYAITNGMSASKAMNLVLLTKWCMDVFYCCFDSLTSWNVPLAQMMDQGVERGGGARISGVGCPCSSLPWAFSS